MSTKEQTLYRIMSEERKSLQAEGLLPQWLTTMGWQLLKNKGYLSGASDLKTVFGRMAKHAATKLKPEHRDYHEGAFYNLMWDGWYAPSTPSYNLGAMNRAMSVSCTGSFITDTVNGFYSNLNEVALLTKLHFGTSSYLGDIRPRGASISGGGKAQGVLPVFKMHSQAMADITQGTKRRGSWAGYLPLMHGDFDEVVDHIKADSNDNNLGINYYDADLIALADAEQEQERRYKKHMHLRATHGKGYIYKPDTVARLQPPMYKEHGLRSQASNLCLVGETEIVVTADNGTTQETVTMKQFCDTRMDKTHKVASNGGFKKVTAAAKTGRHKKLVKVTDDATGKSIVCTPEHKVFTVNRGYVEAQHLVPTDVLKVYGLTCASLCTIQFIEYDEEVDVYDITVPETECFYANGILVHNCTEISLHQDEDHSYSCVLGAMNLKHFDKWSKTDAVFVATVFLDCIVQDLLDSIDAMSPDEQHVLRRVYNGTKKSRALGLGVIGFHTYLQQNMIAFESEEAFDVNEKIFSHIQQESLRASQWLAKEYGEPEWCKGYGVRNTHRTCVAPTLSSSTITESVSQGIEPIYSNVYEQITAGGLVFRSNPQLKKVLEAHGMYSDELITDIGRNYDGSVQHLDFLTDHEKLVFKTAHEIDQYAVVDLTAARQSKICQLQSMNLFIHRNMKEDEFSALHLHILFNPNIGSAYYVRGQAAGKGSDGTATTTASTECESCSV